MGTLDLGQLLENILLKANPGKDQLQRLILQLVDIISTRTAMSRWLSRREFRKVSRQLTVLQILWTVSPTASRERLSFMEISRSLKRSASLRSSSIACGSFRVVSRCSKRAAALELEDIVRLLSMNGHFEGR